MINYNEGLAYKAESSLHRHRLRMAQILESAYKPLHNDLLAYGAYMLI